MEDWELDLLPIPEPDDVLDSLPDMDKEEVTKLRDKWMKTSDICWSCGTEVEWYLGLCRNCWKEAIEMFWADFVDLWRELDE